MKRFLSIILTAAMLMSATPAVFAENNAVDESVIVAEELTPENQEEITGEVTENVTENVSEEISGEGEENSEEQISLMSRENDVSLPADEVQYSTDGSTWKNATLSDAVTAIGKSTGTIKVMKDITLTEGLYIMGDITIIPGTTEDVTIKRGFANGTDASKGNSGDAMITMFMYNNALNEWHNLTGKLTLGSTESGSAKLIFDGNSTQYGSNCNAPILYLLGNPQILPNGVGSCTINNVVFQNNTNSSSGGAICINDNTYLQINDSVFQNCKAKKGGAVYYGNTQLDDAFQSKVTFNNTVFKNNEAENGGALYYDNSITTIENCTFEANTVSGSNGGAAIYTNKFQKVTDKSGNVIEGTETQLKIDSCSFKDNNCIGKPIYNMSAFSYLVSNSIYLNATVDEKTVVLDGKINFDDKTDSDICLYAYGYGSTSYKNVVYLGDNFSSDSAIKVMAGAYAIASASDVAGTYNIPIFKCSSAGKAADYAKLFTPADDGSYGFCNKASQVTFIQDTTDTTGISLAEYVEPEVEATYSYYKYPDGEKTETIRGTLKESLAKMNSASAYPGAIITVLKDIVLDETITLSNEKTIQAKDGETYTLTRAANFTGPMLSITGAKQTIGSENGKLILDGGNADNTDSLIKITKSGAIGITLLNLELKNNNSEKGGAINTTDAAVSAKNITINNCSAVDGGAIYWSLADTNSEEVTLTNSIIKSNTADTGSAIFIKNDNNKWGQLVLNGCTFENNTFSNSESNTDGHTKSTTIYFDNAATTANQYNFINLGGATTFNNQTNSDIMLDNGLATSSSYANLQTISGFANKGQAIKIAVGAFSRNNTTKTYVVNDSGATTDVFKLVGTYAKSDIGDYQLKRTDSHYLSIQAPSKVYFAMYANGGSVSYNSTKKFNEKVKDVQLSVSPAFNVDEEHYKMEYAMDNQEYTLTVTANDSVAITNMYIAYSKGPVEKNEYATVSEDKKSATFTFTTDTLSTIVAGAMYSIPTCKIYVEYQTLAQAITVVQSTGGTISTTPSDKAAKGETVTLTATPNDEYNFNSWNVYKTGDTSAKVTVSGNTFTMPDYPVTVSAVFVKKTHDVTITKEGEGTVAISPETPVEVGQTVTVTATPAEHWELSSLTMNGEDITSAKSFVMPNKAVELKATFVKQKFKVTASATTNGTIELVTESPLNWGDNFTINVNAAPHYEIDTVTVDGKTVTVDGQGDYTFVMPTHDVTVSATFKKVKYTITGKGDHATFSIPSSETYNWGDTVEFTVTPDKWYSVKSIYADNETVVITKVDGKENAYSFTMPQGDVVITAVTERPNSTVTFDSKGGSNITPKTVANGDAADKPGVPVWAGRGFAGWYTDENYTQKYDFATPVTGNITLYARWFLWGDVNNDGVANSADALLIQRCQVGLMEYSVIKNRLAGLVNGLGNGTNYPNSPDALLIKRHSVGLINRYKVEDSAEGYEFDLENDTYIPKN